MGGGTVGAEGGSLTVTATNPSVSELAAAQYMAYQRYDVVLRDPVGTRSGGVIVDLSKTGLTAADFGDNPLARMDGFIASWGKDELTSDVVFFGDD